MYALFRTVFGCLFSTRAKLRSLSQKLWFPDICLLNLCRASLPSHIAKTGCEGSRTVVSEVLPRCQEAFPSSLVVEVPLLPPETPCGKVKLLAYLCAPLGVARWGDPMALSLRPRGGGQEVRVVGWGGQADVLGALQGPQGRVLRGTLGAEKRGREYMGLTWGLHTVGQQLSSLAGRRRTVRAVALSLPRHLLSCKGTARDIFLLDGGGQEGQWLLVAAAALLLLQLHPQLLHLPLLLPQLPGELVDHLLLLHQHLVLLRVQPIGLRGAGTPIQAAQQALVGAGGHRGRMQAETRWRISEGVWQGPCGRQVRWSRGDGWAGARAAEVIEARRGGLVTGQGVGCNRKGDSRDVPEVGHRVASTVLEGSKPVHQCCLGAWHRQASYSKLLS